MKELLELRASLLFQLENHYQFGSLGYNSFSQSLKIVNERIQLIEEGYLPTITNSMKDEIAYQQGY